MGSNFLSTGTDVAGDINRDGVVDIFDLKRSAGIGIRLYMPMLGILGYDIGYGFDSVYGSDNPSGLEHHIIFEIFVLYILHHYLTIRMNQYLP